MKLIWKEVNPHTGKEIDEDAPIVNTGANISLPPDAVHDKKKKKKDLYDGRIKAYKEHRRKLEAARIRRQEALAKKKSGFVEQIIEAAKSSSGYELYHKTFSGAMQHAYAFAKKKGYVVDTDDIDSKVASGPKKPSSGKTNSYILGTDKKQNVHIQVANLDNKRYELNMYIS